MLSRQQTRKGLMKRLSILALLLLPTILLGQASYNIATVPFSLFPNFVTGNGSTLFNFTLTGNVISSSLNGGSLGMEIIFNICQDGVGNHTFPWPPNVNNPPTILSAANACTIAKFINNGGLNWVPSGTNGVANIAVTNGTIANLNVTGTVTVPAPTNCSNSLALGISTTLAANCTNSTGSGALTVGGALTANGGGALNGTFSGPTTLSGNLTVIGTGTLAQVNKTCNVDGTTNTTISGTYTNCVPSTGGTISTPPNYAETVSSQFTVGTATKPLHLNTGFGTVLTSASTGANCLFPIANSSGIQGAGSIGNSMTTITATNAASLTSIVCNADTTGAQEYFTLKNAFIQCTGSPTISSAALDIQSIFTPSEIGGVVLNGCANTKLLRIRNNGTGAGQGPININNPFITCATLAGCTPLSIEAVGTGFHVNQVFLGGTIQHAGTGLPQVNLDCSAQAAKVCFGNVFLGLYEEGSFAASAGNKIKDSSSTLYLGGTIAGVAGTDVFNISQSASAKTQSFGAIGVTDAVGYTNLINNTISGLTITSASSSGRLPFYLFGGDTGGAVAPATFDNLNVRLFSNNTGASAVNSGLLALDGAAAINSTPPAVSSGVLGWKVCYYGAGNCEGITASTHVVMMNPAVIGPWWSLFNATAPAGTGTGTTPDPNAQLSLGSNGELVFKEITAPTGPGANFDSCYGDSTAHAFKCNYNGATNFLPMQQVISTSLTTTAATSDNVTVTGMTASGHCYLTATNAGAAGGIASVFISAKTTNQITVTHTATSGWTFDVVCTPQ